MADRDDRAEQAGAFARATGRTAEGAAEEGAADKPRYRRYQYDLIAPHCGRSVLEVGAGLGEFAAQFTGLDRLVVTDVDPDAVTVAKSRFAEDGTAAREIEVRQFDLAAGHRLDRPVESVVAINVLEHFDDDAGILELLAGSVVPGGSIVLWVPGYQSLYSDFDRRVGHFRRYTPRTLRDAIARSGLACELARPVNLLGGLAWWAAMRLGRARKPASGAVGLYDRVIVPVTRVLDRALPVPFGQSVLAVARVPAGAQGGTEGPGAR
ncbi:class I SAM-dependent methyltransferase [Actinomadura sp. SCN-SB]|uniref:class I SAM-dependent methyltransferase n=1 Tax=Actinomadura sp. SCN-SB TaxID=3373092 RepID=UPI0037506ECE